VPPLPLITSEDFDLLAPEWAALHARVPGATPFLHPEWHRTWLRHFGEPTAPVFLSVRREEELIGVVAFDMASGGARELGDHNVRDYAGPLALPGEEAAVASGTFEWLREDLTSAATFWGIPGASPIHDALVASADAGGWLATESPETVCPGVDLARTFEEYVAALSKSDRHELRRKIRHLEGHAETCEFVSTTDPSEIATGMDTLLALMRRSRGDKEEFLTPTMEAFFREIATTFAALGMLRLSTLRVGGNDVAMTFAFEDDEAVYLYNSGYDPDYAHLAAGLVSKAFALRAAIQAGKKRFDFLRGSEDYKRRLGGIDRELVTLSFKA